MKIMNSNLVSMMIMMMHCYIFREFHRNQPPYLGIKKPNRMVSIREQFFLNRYKHFIHVYKGLYHDYVIISNLSFCDDNDDVLVPESLVVA